MESIGKLYDIKNDLVCSTTEAVNLSRLLPREVVIQFRQIFQVHLEYCVIGACGLSEQRGIGGPCQAYRDNLSSDVATGLSEYSMIGFESGSEIPLRSFPRETSRVILVVTNSYLPVPT